MILHQYKCIFIHIPKCAGTSIEKALGHLDNYQGRRGQDHRTIRMIEQPLLTPHVFSSKENISEVLLRVRHNFRGIYKSSTAMNPNNKLTVTKEQYNRYYKFTIVRNPWARAFSWYKNVMRDDNHKKIHKITGDLPFKEFLRSSSGKGMLQPQTYWIKSFDGSINLDYIGRFETLAKDFQEICKAINIPQVTLPHKIKGTGEDYRQYYDDDSIQIISQIYEEEINLFNYSFDSLLE